MTPTSSTSAHQVGPSAVEAEVVRLTNLARSRAGCPPLRTDARLVQAAREHSADMANRNYFSHVSPGGSTFLDRVGDAGYPSPGGENIAWGQRTAESVVRDWMNSPGHRHNILDCDFTAIGVGFDPRGNYWTEEFGF